AACQRRERVASRRLPHRRKTLGLQCVQDCFRNRRLVFHHEDRLASRCHGLSFCLERGFEASAAVSGYSSRKPGNQEAPDSVFALWPPGFLASGFKTPPSSTAHSSPTHNTPP